MESFNTFVLIMEKFQTKLLRQKESIAPLEQLLRENVWIYFEQAEEKERALKVLICKDPKENILERK